MNFQDKILLNELKFNDTDDQIIDYIKDNKTSFVNQSIQKTAQALYTVPNTLVRFSRKLGYNGFSELKFALKQEMDIEDREKESKNQIATTKIPDTILKTLELIDSDTIDKVVRKIREARKVMFLGIGDSIYFCEMFAKNIRCVGKRVEFFHHRHDMLYNVENCDPKDIYIALSVSGESKEIIEAVEKAKERGAYIISVTHLSENTLSKLSDINLFFWGPKQIINKYNATDRVGIMVLIRMISERFWQEFNCE